MITIALTKGRILKETLPILEAAGIVPAEDINVSRKLVLATNLPGVQLLTLRGSDVLTYIRHGAADIGVVGKDMLLEDGGDQLYELLDLNIATCRLMTAAITDQSALNDREKPVCGARIKVASKYVNIARQYYAHKGVQADIIKLYGGMELAPLMGLADEIVDIVDSGKTLAANGLAPKEEIAQISSRLVANKASMKVKHTALKALIDSIEASVKGA